MILAKPRRLLLLCLVALAWGGTSAAHAATFTVTDDGDTAHGACGSNCTMRDAIIAANASPGSDTIAFANPSTFLYSGTPLPTVTGPTIIDGTTSPTGGWFLFSLVNVPFPGITLGASGITLKNFYSHGGFAVGIRIQSPGGDVVQGGRISSMTGPAVLVDNSANNQIGGSLPAQGLELESNLYGVAITGKKATGNHIEGCSVESSYSEGIFVLSPNNVIGGSAPGAGNTVIGGNAHGITIYGKLATGNVIQGNLVGDVDGTYNNHNRLSGIYVVGKNTLVGGTTPGARNVVSGNAWATTEIGAGIFLVASGNTVSGNYVGTDPSGTVRRPNSYQGINDEVGGNVIGGTTPGAGNLVSGNQQSGIRVAGRNDLIAGNLVGVDSTGAAELSNGSSGILLLTGPATIGGTTPGARNLISGTNPTQFGILVRGSSAKQVLIQGNYIGTDISGMNAIPGAVGGGINLDFVGGVTVGGTPPGAGNLISGTEWGLAASGTGIVVQGNLIGTTADGNSALPNGRGVSVDGSFTIGGSTSEARNVISGNGQFGIMVSGGAGLIAGNYIGTDLTGLSAIPNTGNGIALEPSATGVTIGGPTAAEMNIISGNAGSGIYARGDDFNPTKNAITGNRIGTDVTGSGPLANALDGIRLDGVNGFTIGVSGGKKKKGKVGKDGKGGKGAPGIANLISGNLGSGIRFVTHPTTLKNVIAGNLIGVDAAGTAPLGNGSDGIAIEVGGGITIGGASAAEGNLISGNTGAGIRLGADASVTKNVITANRIGPDGAGTGLLGNALAGISVDGGTLNTIGGLTAGAGNTVAGNGGAGIAVVGGTGNAVLGGSFFANTGLPIDLGNDGATANDALDSDPGPDDLQNYPLLSTPATAVGETTIAGTLSSTPSRTFTIVFYASPATDTDVEGRTMLGSTSVTTAADGSASFSLTANAVAAGTLITAAAFDSGAGNTSELSPAVSA
jgi:hypothetical protein